MKDFERVRFALVKVFAILSAPVLSATLTSYFHYNLILPAVLYSPLVVLAVLLLLSKPVISQFKTKNTVNN